MTAPTRWQREKQQAERVQATMRAVCELMAREDVHVQVSVAIGLQRDIVDSIDDAKVRADMLRTLKLAAGVLR